MDYEQKYKEALDKAKKLYGEGTITESLSYVFPELKESEDEEMRKALINGLNDCMEADYLGWSDFGGMPIEDLLAWLEKQGEHNSFSWTEDDEAKVKAMCEEGNLKPSEREWLNNLRYRVTEHKPTDKYEPMSLDEAIKHCKEKSCGNNACALEHKQLEKWLTELKKLKEQKPTWSEEDEEIYRKCICAMRASACGFPEEEKFVEQVDNWFKSLKDRVQLLPRQEWSKEDNEMFLQCCAAIRMADHLSIDDRSMMEKWFRNLKDRYSWKPSDDEMKALAEALSLANNCGEEYAFDLRTLQDQLKKLK